MSAPLASRIADRREEMIVAIQGALHASSARHYRGTEASLLAERVARLVDAFVESLRGNPGRFMEYVRSLAEERISEGFLLREIQLAMNLLGEEAWKIGAAGGTELSEVVRDLGLLSSLVGCAKDQLAQVYLEQKERCMGDVARLEEELRTLAAGTDAHEAPEDP
jgi:hypothetical protein